MNRRLKFALVLAFGVSLALVVPALAQVQYTTPDIEFWFGGFSGFDGTYTVTVRSAADSTVVATGVPHHGALIEHSLNVTIYSDTVTEVSVYGIENGTMVAYCRSDAYYDTPATPNGCGTRYR